jgi:hypothetical protein
MGMADYRTNPERSGGQPQRRESAFPELTVVNLERQADSVDQTYKNFVVVNITTASR